MTTSKYDRRKDLDSFHGIKLLEEENYSAGRSDVPFWDGNFENFPLKPGDTFPDNLHKFRANINKTMSALIQGDLQDCLEEYITNFPTLDPLTNKRVSNIISSLYTFQLLLRSWRQLIRPIFKGIKIDGVERPEIFERIPFNDIITNKFINCDGLLVTYKQGNDVSIKVFNDKNIYLVRDKADDIIPSLTNIFKEDEKTYIEVVTFYQGRTYRQLFNYNKGKIGNLIDGRFIENTEEILYVKNGETTAEVSYGRPELANCITPTLAIIRAFNTLCLLLEKKRQVLTVVPDTAISKDVITGAAVFQTSGTIPYSTQQSEVIHDNHDVKYATPDVKLQELLDAFNILLKQMSLYSGLSSVILGIKEIGANSSGRALVTACAPTLIMLRGYTEEITNLLTSLAEQMLDVAGFDGSAAKIELVTDSPDKVLYSLVNGYDDMSQVTNTSNIEQPKEEEDANSTDEVQVETTIE